MKRGWAGVPKTGLSVQKSVRVTAYKGIDLAVFCQY